MAHHKKNGSVNQGVTPHAGTTPVPYLGGVDRLREQQNYQILSARGERNIYNQP
jgi:hypothetical protein